MVILSRGLQIMEHYDLEKMKNLLKDFHNLTGIKISLYDDTETEFCFYPEKHTPFCQLLRQNAHFNKECETCDKRAFAECKKTHRQYRYICHVGLLECISPIVYGENIIGYIAIGQIRTKDGNLRLDALKNLEQQQIDELQKRYDNLPLADFDKIQSAFRILDVCASYEYLKNMLNTKNGTIDALIERFINSRLKEPLSVQELCLHFHLSRNELYSIFKNYFNDSPAEYIKKRRLNRACEYLTSTNLPVNIIAQKCGIPDYNYFSKLFKKCFGISPRTYRATH